MSWRSRFGPKPVAFILGNEGGDMDSVVCAFMMSKLINKASLLLSSNNSNASSWVQQLQHHSCIPVCNFAKAELSLRQDIILAFEKCNLNISSSNIINNPSSSLLTFADELPFLKSFQDEDKNKETLDVLIKHNDCIILVDHNIPCPSQMHLCPLVRGIIDHHALPPHPIKFDEHHHHHLNLIETIGSAASLVARLYLEMKIELEPEEAQLLLSPILMDTQNFNPAAKKAVQGDFEAREFLLQGIKKKKASDGTSSTAAESEHQEEKSFCYNLFTELAEARESYEKLSISDALKKDTKLFQFATSTKNKLLSMPIASWAENLEKHVLERFKMSELLTELVKFCEERDSSTDGSMALFFKDGQRHLVYFAKSELGQKALQSFFEFHKSQTPTFTNLTESMIHAGDYDKEKFAGDHQFGVYLFDDATISRKQLTPKLTDFFLTFPSA